MTSENGNLAEEEETLNRLVRASKVVEEEGVKLNKFSPSGISIWTVAGRDCSYLVDCAPPGGKSYCSCDDFHYRVLSGKVGECYHLVAARKAIAKEMYNVIEHRDDEYPSFMKKLLTEVFANIS